MPIPLLVAYAAAPKVVPIIVAALVFIVLAGISIGIGTAEKLPKIGILLLVAVSAGLSGWAYKSMKHRMNPGDHPAGPTYIQSEMPKSIPSQPAGQLSPPVMPASIMPPSW